MTIAASGAPSSLPLRMIEDFGRNIGEGFREGMRQSATEHLPELLEYMETYQYAMLPDEVKAVHVKTRELYISALTVRV